MENKNGMVRPHRPKIIALIRLLDVLIIWFSLQIILLLNQQDFQSNELWWVMIAVVSFEFFAELNLLYNAPRGVNLYVEAQKTFATWIGVLLIFGFVLYFFPLLVLVEAELELELEQVLLWYWLALVPFLLIAWHLFMRLIINLARERGRNMRQVAVIGATNIGYELERIIKRDKWLGFKFCGYFDDRIKKEKGRQQRIEQPLAGNTQQLIKRANQHEIDVVYITLPLKAEKRIKQILEGLADTTAVVYYVPDLFAFDLLRARMDNLSGIPVISIHDTPFYGIDGLSKRLFDIVLSTAILSVISIPMLAIALVIKMTSAGPVIFKQQRYGFRGETIDVWKFRSMTSTDNGEHIQQAIKNDMRITKLGAFLRRTSLDELPQFINVLQGRMSIIGPRPHAVAHNEMYRGQIKGYMLRHRVKPGITGLAQISGFRGETDTLDKMEGRIHYDLEYIRNWSLMLDIKIFLKTILKGFLSEQAY